MERDPGRLVGGGLAAAVPFLASSLAVAQEPDEARIRAIVEEVLAEKKLEGGTTFRAYWKDGLFFETADGDFRLSLGGRIQTDFGFISEDTDIQDAIGNQENGAEIRRARLHLAGTFLERYGFKVEFDFAGGDADFKDVFAGVLGIPVLGSLRVGHMKEPFSLEQVTSSRFLTFLERSLADAFTPQFNTGIRVGDEAFGDRATWALGVFRDSDDFGNSLDDGGYGVVARVTGLPWASESNDRLLHLGVSFRCADPFEDMLQFRSRPEFNLADRYVDTGLFEADADRRVGLEAAAVLGPASIQGEYLHVNADTPGENPMFHGWYAFASLFLTGESRAYSRSNGCFDRVKPKARFLDGEGGWGAWEVAARYSAIDLDDEGIDGGEMRDVTGGLNWYPTSNTRVMTNYVFADLEGVGESHSLAFRFQVDF